jgi:hypothetical protein
MTNRQKEKKPIRQGDILHRHTVRDEQATLETERKQEYDTTIILLWYSGSGGGGGGGHRTSR